MRVSPFILAGMPACAYLGPAAAGPRSDIEVRTRAAATDNKVTDLMTEGRRFVAKMRELTTTDLPATRSQRPATRQTSLF